MVGRLLEASNRGMWSAPPEVCLCACVCVCVLLCARACVRACVRARARACVSRGTPTPPHPGEGGRKGGRERGYGDVPARRDGELCLNRERRGTVPEQGKMANCACTGKDGALCLNRYSAPSFPASGQRRLWLRDSGFGLEQAQCTTFLFWVRREETPASGSNRHSSPSFFSVWGQRRRRLRARTGTVHHLSLLGGARGDAGFGLEQAQFNCA